MPENLPADRPVPARPAPTGRSFPSGLARRIALAATATALVLGLAPAANSAPADPEVLTLSKSSDLVNGETVTVTYTGFPAEDTLNLVTCDVPFATFDDCQFLTLVNPVSDANGAGTFDYLIEVILGDGGNFPFTCDSANPCQVALFADVTDVTVNRAFAPFSYVPGTAAGATTTTTTTAAGATTTTAPGATTTTAAGATTTTAAATTTVPTTVSSPPATSVPVTTSTVGPTTTRPPRRATTVVAVPAVARLLPSLRIVFPQLSATLTDTATGSALEGRLVRFTAGGVVCFGETNAQGVATCRTKGSFRALAAFGYVAKFQGDREHLRSIDFAPLVEIELPELPQPLGSLASAQQADA
ncbi:MAG: neocarzinostatin apoprotein domain-containing protein [Acidimicrobiales bacterium]